MMEVSSDVNMSEDSDENNNSSLIKESQDTKNEQMMEAIAHTNAIITQNIWPSTELSPNDTQVYDPNSHEETSDDYGIGNMLNNSIYDTELPFDIISGSIIDCESISTLTGSRNVANKMQTHVQSQYVKSSSIESHKQEAANLVAKQPQQQNQLCRLFHSGSVIDLTLNDKCSPLSECAPSGTNPLQSLTASFFGSDNNLFHNSNESMELVAPLTSSPSENEMKTINEMASYSKDLTDASMPFKKRIKDFISYAEHIMTENEFISRPPCGSPCSFPPEHYVEPVTFTLKPFSTNSSTATTKLTAPSLTTTSITTTSLTTASLATTSLATTSLATTSLTTTSLTTTSVTTTSLTTTSLTTTSLTTTSLTTTSETTSSLIKTFSLISTIPNLILTSVADVATSLAVNLRFIQPIRSKQQVSYPPTPMLSIANLVDCLPTEQESYPALPMLSIANFIEYLPTEEESYEDFYEDLPVFTFPESSPSPEISPVTFNHYPYNNASTPNVQGAESGSKRASSKRHFESENTFNLIQSHENISDAAQIINQCHGEQKLNEKCSNYRIKFDDQ